MRLTVAATVFACFVLALAVSARTASAGAIKKATKSSQLIANGDMKVVQLKKDEVKPPKEDKPPKSDKDNNPGDGNNGGGNDDKPPKPPK
jgi:hypothetical protein